MAENPKTSECPLCWTPNSTRSRCVRIPGCKSAAIQEIAANYAVANDPNQVRRILVSRRIVANASVASKLSSKDLVEILVNYYVQNGGLAYSALLSTFVPNPNANNKTTDEVVLRNTIADLGIQIQGINTETLRAASSNGGSVTISESCDWSCQLWKGLVGSSQSTTAPTVSTTTTTSPLAAAYILAGLAILGILAWVVIKS